MASVSASGPQPFSSFQSTTQDINKQELSGVSSENTQKAKNLEIALLNYNGDLSSATGVKSAITAIDGNDNAFGKLVGDLHKSAAALGDDLGGFLHTLGDADSVNDGNALAPEINLNSVGNVEISDVRA